MSPVNWARVGSCCFAARILWVRSERHPVAVRGNCRLGPGWRLLCPPACLGPGHPARG